MMQATQTVNVLVQAGFAKTLLYKVEHRINR